MQLARLDGFGDARPVKVRHVLTPVIGDRAGMSGMDGTADTAKEGLQLGVAVAALAAGDPGPSINYLITKIVPFLLAYGTCDVNNPDVFLIADYNLNGDNRYRFFKTQYEAGTDKNGKYLAEDLELQTACRLLSQNSTIVQEAKDWANAGYPQRQIFIDNQFAKARSKKADLAKAQQLYASMNVIPVNYGSFIGGDSIQIPDLEKSIKEAIYQQAFKQANDSAANTGAAQADANKKMLQSAANDYLNYINPVNPLTGRLSIQDTVNGTLIPDKNNPASLPGAMVPENMDFYNNIGNSEDFQNSINPSATQESQNGTSSIDANQSALNQNSVNNQNVKNMMSNVQYIPPMPTALTSNPSVPADAPPETGKFTFFDGIRSFIQANPIPTALIGAGVVAGAIVVIHAATSKKPKKKGMRGLGSLNGKRRRKKRKAPVSSQAPKRKKTSKRKTSKRKLNYIQF